MTPGAKGGDRDGGPRRFAYNIDAAREREMHLYEIFVRIRDLKCSSNCTK
jgi:hypothetical protein